MEHHFPARLDWSGSTSGGYRSYSRTHAVVTPPVQAPLLVSADRHYRGDPAHLNPEQLLVTAAASCQMLSFLALAAREGIDVLGYSDDAEAVMDTRISPIRVGQIHLRPKIVLASGEPVPLAEALVQRAHQECFIANSLTSTIDIVATIETAAAG